VYLDVYFCYATGGVWVLLFGLYAVRLARRGAFQSDRVDKMGGSALVGRGIMEATYWAIEPLLRGMARVGITPNGVTWGCLVLGTAAGVAAGAGWFGLACLLATMSTIGDILDGQLARLTSKSGDRGELLDAAVDRYTEFALIAGIAILVRASWWQLSLALGALLASFMISYSTAKAEALGVKPPRGLMRRHERAVYLIVGTGLVPLLRPHIVARGWPYTAPVLIALALVAIIGNAAAVIRFVRIHRSLP
jgi:phosphatidylglycerophosphate synthase